MSPYRIQGREVKIDSPEIKGTTPAQKVSLLADLREKKEKEVLFAKKKKAEEKFLLLFKSKHYPKIFKKIEDLARNNSERFIEINELTEFIKEDNYNFVSETLIKTLKEDGFKIKKEKHRNTRVYW